MKISLRIAVLSVFALTFAHSRASASTTDDEIGYDTLVKELSTDMPVDGDMFANVEIHFGAALANSMTTIVPKGAGTLYSAQRGVQASLGIDLFSRHWLAEGSFINYIDRKVDDYDIRLKEFDLRVIYRTRLDGPIGMRLGGGLAARYLTLETGGASETFTTPFSVISGGLETYLVKNFSIGAEVAARTTMTYETPDHSALDLTLRFDGHF